MLADQLASRFEHHLLFAHDGDWRIEGPDAEAIRLRCAWFDGLGRTVRRLEAAFVHVHHLPQGLPGLERLRVPYGVTVHDFHPVCPRNHLVPPDDVYCGAPEDVALCRRCLAAEPRRKVDPMHWRARHGALLRGARFVAVPSRYTGDVLARHWPDLPFVHVPHPYHPQGCVGEAPLCAGPDGRYPVAVVGALGREKGGEMLERLAARAEARGLPLRFVMLGDTHRLGGPQSLYGGHLFVNGSYRLEALPGLLREHGAVLALFPAIGPETFSLTLSEVWACGLPAMVPDMGALAERVRETGAGWTLADWHSPDAWLDALMARLGDSGALARAGRAARHAVSRVVTGKGWYEELYSMAVGTAEPGE